MVAEVVKETLSEEENPPSSHLRKLQRHRRNPRVPYPEYEGDQELEKSSAAVDTSGISKL